MFTKFAFSHGVEYCMSVCLCVCERERGRVRYRYKKYAVAMMPISSFSIHKSLALMTIWADQKFHSQLPRRNRNRIKQLMEKRQNMRYTRILRQTDRQTHQHMELRHVQAYMKWISTFTFLSGYNLSNQFFRIVQRLIHKHLRANSNSVV